MAFARKGKGSKKQKRSYRNKKSGKYERQRYRTALNKLNRSIREERKKRR